MPLDLARVDEVREASRSLVRGLGVTSDRFAGTNLSPSAVHTLIELDSHALSSKDLGALLGLEKSSVSRLVRKLENMGYLEQTPSEYDGRVKFLSLTPEGRAKSAEITAYGRAQASKMLDNLDTSQSETVLQGLKLYTRALGGSVALRPIKLVEGYTSGLIARITEMHVAYYRFDQRFESFIAGDLAEFCNRLESPKTAVWSAQLDGSIVGSIAVDGDGPAAQLRWFITSGIVRGYGVGKRLLDAAMAFVDDRQFAETYLWTFPGLSAANYLYKCRDFDFAEERMGQWGNEQKYIRVTR